MGCKEDLSVLLHLIKGRIYLTRPLWYLRQFSLLQELPEADLRHVGEITRMVEIRKGEVLYLPDGILRMGLGFLLARDHAILMECLKQICFRLHKASSPEHECKPEYKSENRDSFKYN